MKKIYFAPELKVVRLNNMQHLMVTSEEIKFYGSGDDENYTGEATDNIVVD